MYKIREKCIPINLTHSCKSGIFIRSFKFHEKCTHIDFIHDNRVEFTENSWRINNQIYDKFWIAKKDKRKSCHGHKFYVEIKYLREIQKPELICRLIFTDNISLWQPLSGQQCPVHISAGTATYNPVVPRSHDSTGSCRGPRAAREQVSPHWNKKDFTCTTT